MWSYTFTPPHIFMTYRLIVHRGNFVIASPKTLKHLKQSIINSGNMIYSNTVHGITGETTIEPPTTTPDTLLPTAPSNIDSDISVYVSGIGAYQVRYYFSFLL